VKFSDLKKRVDEVPELATLPGVTAELLSILQSKDVPIEYISAIIETDPALTTKILRAIRSLREKSPETIVSIHEVISHLGLYEIRTILFHFTVYSKLFRFKSEQQDWMHQYWVHSVACAYVSRMLAIKFGIQTENREFIAGLLHDLGKLYLIQFQPNQCNQIQQSITETSMNDIDAENKLLGATHAMIGGWLAERWDLPPAYVEIMKYHHEPRMATTDQNLSALINFAETCCIKIGYGFMEGSFTLPIDHSRGWAILESLHPSLGKMDEMNLLTDIKSELKNQPGFMTLVQGDNLFPTIRSDHTTNIDVLRARIDAVQELDSLPSVTTKLLTFLDDPNVSLGKLSSIVKGDPALSDRVLRIVNSPFYDFQDRFRTIQQAAAFLGLSEFTNLLVAISFISILYSKKAQTHPKIEAYWNHAIGCGMISHFLASQLSLPTRGREFTAGILHDLGKLVLVEYFTAAADMIDMRIQTEQCSDIQAEIAIIGVPHTEIGGWVAEKWNLPDSYIEVMRFHHVPSQAHVNTLLVSTIHVADTILQMRGTGLPEGPMHIDMSTDEGWQTLTNLHPQARDIDPVHLITEVPFSIDDARNFLALISGESHGTQYS